MELGNRNTHTLRRRILISCQDVRAFVVEDRMFISTYATPHCLRVVARESYDGEIVHAFLEVGDFTYYLIPGITCCIQLDANNLMLTNLNSDEGSQDLKLQFPSESRARTRNRFYRIVQDIVGSSENTPSTNENRNDVSYLPNNIREGAESFSQSLVFGAEAASRAMDYVTPEIIKKIIPEANPATVDPTLQVGLKFARYSTQGVATAAEILGCQVGALASYAGQSLAPHVQHIGTDLLTSKYNYSQEEAERAVNKALALTAGVAEGIATVCQGAVEALKIIGSSFADNTVKVVKHTYGESVGEAAEDALRTVGNIGAAKLNARLIGKKVIAVQTTRKMLLPK